MITRPNIRRMAPNSHGHIGLALNSVNSVCMYEPRIATVVGTIEKNGPSTRANIRVLICDRSNGLIAVPPSRRIGAYPLPSRESAELAHGRGVDSLHRAQDGHRA